MGLALGLVLMKRYMAGPHTGLATCRALQLPLGRFPNGNALKMVFDTLG